jgi:hypothetical protein
VSAPAPALYEHRRDGAERVVTFRPHAGQWEAWQSRARYVALIAGSGGGKTAFGAAWTYRESIEHPGEYLAFAPVDKMLHRVLIPTFLGLAEPLGVTFAKADMRADFPNGSTLTFITAEAPERAEGIHARGIWLDEAGQMSALMWETAQRRTAMRQGRILLTTTPYNLGWLRSQVYDRWAAGDGNYLVVTFPSIANPAYPVEEFERARRELSADRFAMFYLGEFRRAAGLVYPDWSPATMLLPPVELPATWRRVIGLDLGWHNATAALLLAEDPDGQLVVEREHYASEMLLADHAAVLKAWGKHRIYADPSAAQQIQELNRAGLEIRDAQNDVLSGIDAVTKLMRTDRFRVLQGRAPHLLEELESYAWETREEQVTDKPRKVDDHCVDALRYAVASLAGKKRRQRSWAPL